MSTTGNVRVYRRKPFDVEAIQWTGDNTEEVEDFLGEAFGGRAAGHNVGLTRIWVENPFKIQTLYRGYYAVKEEDGNCYALSKEAFEAVYDLVGKED